MKILVKAQFVVLLLGTLFAWGNFIWEVINWWQDKTCEIGCPISLTNPLLTSCFWGAVFFTMAFVLNIFIMKSLKHKNIKTISNKQ
jgi:hypothetical protein